MDEETRDDAANLLQNQYPPITARQELLDERGSEKSENDEARASEVERESIEMVDSGEEIEMAEIVPNGSLSVDEIIGHQPTSRASIGTIECSSEYEIGPPASSSEPGSESRMDSSNGTVGFAERLKLALDNDGEDDLLISPRPTKSQVLHYFARAQKFTIRRVERDIQISDADGFPLFDAYVDADCAGRIWTIESYGKPVLFMREYTTNDWCQNAARAHVAVRDWNGDFFGELLPGDPFYMHGSEKKVVAKMVRHGPSAPPQSANGGSSEESTALASSMGGSTGALLAPNKPSCWLCVQEENERHIARLEDYKMIQFNKDVAFQLKLLSLAAIIRLVGQVGLAPAANCVGVVKTILNCCAGF